MSLLEGAEVSSVCLIVPSLKIRSFTVGLMRFLSKKLLWSDLRRSSVMSMVRRSGFFHRIEIEVVKSFRFVLQFVNIFDFE